MAQYRRPAQANVATRNLPPNALPKKDHSNEAICAVAEGGVHTPLDCPDIPVSRCNSCSSEAASCSEGSRRSSGGGAILDFGAERRPDFRAAPDESDVTPRVPNPGRDSLARPASPGRLERSGKVSSDSFDSDAPGFWPDRATGLLGSELLMPSFDRPGPFQLRASREIAGTAKAAASLTTGKKLNSLTHARESPPLLCPGLL